MGKRILVAEDEPTSRAVTLRCLEAAGYTTLSAEDGLRALAAAETESPDLILLDLLLPRRDGYAVLLDLRSRERTRAVPVIVLSGEEGDDHATVAKALGAQGFISKPYRDAALLSRVEQALREGVPA